MIALVRGRSEEHTSELQSHVNLVFRLLLEKKKELDRAVVRLCYTTCEKDLGRIPSQQTRHLFSRRSHRLCRNSALIFLILRVGVPPLTTLFPHPPLFR